MRKALRVFPFVLFLVVGCTLPDIFRTVEERGGDLADQAYALVASFDVIDEAALELAERPDTPPGVVATLKSIREPARRVIPLIVQAALSWRDARNRLDDQDNPSTIAELTVVVEVLSARINSYAPAVNRFIDYVNSL